MLANKPNGNKYCAPRSTSLGSIQPLGFLSTGDVLTAPWSLILSSQSPCRPHSFHFEIIQLCSAFLVPAVVFQDLTLSLLGCDHRPLSALAPSERCLWSSALLVFPSTWKLSMTPWLSGKVLHSPGILITPQLGTSLPFQLVALPVLVLCRH